MKMCNIEIKDIELTEEEKEWWENNKERIQKNSANHIRKENGGATRIKIHKLFKKHKI
ncbi:MAG: hypothetical protein ACOCP8_03800 [archaeon]